MIPDNENRRPVDAPVPVRLKLAALWTSAMFCYLYADYFGLFIPGTLEGMYGFDKSAAQRGRQRTPENTLHIVALLGGWPGALLAQDLFRHKSSKAEVQWMFWTTVVVNCGALVWLLRFWPPQ